MKIEHNLEDSWIENYQKHIDSLETRLISKGMLRSLGDTFFRSLVRVWTIPGFKFRFSHESTRIVLLSATILFLADDGYAHEKAESKVDSIMCASGLMHRNDAASSQEKW